MKSALPALMLLAACATPGPAPETVGEVRIDAQTYPIEATANGNWRVRIENQVVACSKPDEDSCYWSARNHLNATILLDDLG
ncbi:MAG: hypothetical protein R3E44_07850 [Paracoccaceae bacterium]